MCKCESDARLAPVRHPFGNTLLKLSSRLACRWPDDVLSAREVAIERERLLEGGRYVGVVTGDSISDAEAAWWREANRWGC